MPYKIKSLHADVAYNLAKKRNSILAHLPKEDFDKLYCSVKNKAMPINNERH